MNDQQKTELLTLIQQHAEAARCGIALAAQCTLKEIAARIQAIPPEPSTPPPPTDT
jgi:hypothetical protein